jgi:hypothetical protein
MWLLTSVLADFFSHTSSRRREERLYILTTNTLCPLGECMDRKIHLKASPFFFCNIDFHGK